MGKTGSPGWLLLAFCVLIQVLTIGTGTYAFAFFVLPWMQEFSAPRSELMMAMTGCAIAMAVLSALCGTLIDRYSARLLVAAGTVVFSGGLFALALAPSAAVVVAVFTLVLPFGMIFCGPLMAQTLAARHFIERRGMALGICALGTSFGGLLVPPLVTALLEHHSWRYVMTLLGAAGLVVILPLALLLLRPHPVAVRRQGRGAFIRLIRNPSVMLLALAYVLPSSLFIAVLYNIGAYAADLGVSQQHAGAVISVTSLLMVASKFTVGALADRVDSRTIYFSVLALMAAAMLLIGSAGNVYTLSIGVPLLGTAVGGVMPLMGSIVARRFGHDSFGSVMGVILAVAAMSGLAPAVVGLVRDLSGSYSYAFLGMTLLLIPAALCFLAAGRAAPRAVQPAAA
jgi:MFS family permease